MAHILIVDDSPTEAHILSTTLAKLGHETSTAVDGEDGIAKAKEILPDLILMDVVMPGLNGFQATRQLSQHATTSHIPVVMVTTKDQKTDRMWAERQGAKGYITKPFVEEVLVARLRSLLLIKAQYDKINTLQNELSLAAYRDHIPGIYHKQYLVEQGDNFLLEDVNLPLAVLYIDINQFKEFNDKYGMLEGDKVITNLAQHLLTYFPKKSCIVHYKSDDFIVFIKNHDSEKSKAMATELHASLKQYYKKENPISISIGLSNSDEHPSINLSKLISLAGDALDAARRNGEFSTSIFTKHDIISF